MGCLVDFTVDAHDDWRLADGFERGLGWKRGKREVELRFELPGTHFVARDEAGHAIGTVSCVLHAASEVAPMSLAWIGGLVVDEAARGRGVGRALLRAATDAAEAAGADAIGLDATSNGRALYEREGFRAVGSTSRWARPTDAARPTPGERSEAAIYPISACEIMDLAAYDGPRFGAGRIAWLASVMASSPERAFVAFHRKSGGVSGYVLSQEKRIGPLVADDPATAAWLLLACERAGGPPVVDALDDNPHVHDVLATAGYARTNVGCTRMVRGAEKLPGDVRRMFVIGAGALG